MDLFDPYHKSTTLQFVESVRAGSCHPGIFRDWLDEQGAELADVVRLYALPPQATHDCSMCQGSGKADVGFAVVVPCLKCCGVGVTPCLPRRQVDDSLRDVLAIWEEASGRQERAAKVRAWKLRPPHSVKLRGGATSPLWWVSSPEGKLLLPYSRYGGLSEAEARLGLKNVVLGLFDRDVRFPVRVYSPVITYSPAVGETIPLMPYEHFGGRRDGRYPETIIDSRHGVAYSLRPYPADGLGLWTYQEGADHVVLRAKPSALLTAPPGSLV